MSGENRNALVEDDFGDGTYTFRLPLGQLEELQEKTGVGPFKLAQRMLSGEWAPRDVYETLRLGLIGGGTKSTDALALIRRYGQEEGLWLRNVDLAQRVIWAALAGAPEEQPGKDDAPEAAMEDPNFQTDASPLANSTEPQPLLA